MRRVQRALGLTLLVLCAVLAGLLVYRSRVPRARELSVAASAESAQGAGEPGASALDRNAIPDTVPDVRMPALNGQQQSLRSYLGHSLIINFWATWCPPCRREMPLLQQLWTRYEGSGVRIVGIAVDTPEAVKQYLRQTSVTYPLLVGEAEGTAAAARFGIEPVLPFTVFTDARGRIVAVKIGELHRTEAEYIISALQRVTDGRQTLTDARAAIASEMRQLAAEQAKGDVRADVGQARQH